jgi:hypothetical protein
MVGWTVLNGKEFDENTGGIHDAAGDTIVNLKAGIRVAVGDHADCGFSYGRALTGDVWYKEIYRVEFRLTF